MEPGRGPAAAGRRPVLLRSGGSAHVILRIWNGTERTLLGLLGGIALVLSGYEILTRYLFPQHAPDWGEEVIVYVVMWGVFMSGSGLVGDNHHVRADIIVRMLGEQQQRLCEIFNTLLGIGFTGAMAWFGWEVVEFALMLDERSISSLRFPIAWYYLCLPVGMGLMALRFTIRLYELLFRFDPARHTLREDDFSHD